MSFPLNMVNRWLTWSDKQPLPFEQTTVHVLWLASDHLHLYIDATPDYSLDEIVHAIVDDLERGDKGNSLHCSPVISHAGNERILPKG